MAFFEAGLDQCHFRFGAIMYPHLQRVVLRLGIFFAGLMIAGHPATAQQFVANGQFDTDVSGWTTDPAAALAWAAFDHNNSVASGSAQVNNTAAAASVRIVALKQCYELTRSGRYYLSAKGFLPAAQTSGRLVVSFIYHADTLCTGGSFSSGGIFLSAIGVWQSNASELATDVVLGPGTSASVEIALSIEKDAAGGALTGYFDNVRFYSNEVFSGSFEGP
jgi:hypothetical protein